MGTKDLGLTHPVSIRFDPAQLSRVEKVRVKENKSRAGSALSTSETIRLLIEESLKKRGVV